MDMIRCHDVVEHAQTEALLRFENPMQVTTTITRKLEEKFSLMAAVSNVPDVSRDKVTVSARHRFRFLRGHFLASKS
jgi:hypothetical protein